MQNLLSVAFNQEHFGCKKFYHQNGEKSWIVPVSKKETPAVTVKRILQILVPSNFYCHTDKMRKKTVYKRDERHRVLSVEEIDKILNVADDIIANREKYSEVCHGKKLATLFFEPSIKLLVLHLKHTQAFHNQLSIL